MSPRAPRLELLVSHHDSPAAGHFGRKKALNLISREHWGPEWPSSFTHTWTPAMCAEEQRSRSTSHSACSSLATLERDGLPSMELTTDSPDSRGDTCIIQIVVDRLSKMAHFVTCPALPAAEELASLFLHNAFRLHGLPDDLGCQIEARNLSLDSGNASASRQHSTPDGWTDRAG